MPTLLEPPDTSPTNTAQQRMVRSQLVPRGIRDPRVLAAMAKVPREHFVADTLLARAYEDGPLPTLEGQTISQPYIVAASTEFAELGPSDRVLEIGTGSGYSTAVLAECCQEVFSIERNAELSRSAAQRLAALGYDNCHVQCGDGSLGWADEAPFNAVIVAAVGPRVPATLLQQLAVGGRLIMPVGAAGGSQSLYRVRHRSPGVFEYQPMFGVRFVQLIGAEAFSPSNPAAAPA